MILQTFALPEVQQFVEELKTKRAGCFEGQFCSHLDEFIGCQAEACRDLNGAIATWKERVFRGQVAFDPQVESAFLEQAADAITMAQDAVNLAREREAECFEIVRLRELEKEVRILTRRVQRWVRPQLSARPAYRKQLTADEIATLKRGLGSGQ